MAHKMRCRLSGLQARGASLVGGAPRTQGEEDEEQGEGEGEETSAIRTENLPNIFPTNITGGARGASSSNLLASCCPWVSCRFERLLANPPRPAPQRNAVHSAVGRQTNVTRLRTPRTKFGETSGHCLPYLPLQLQPASSPHCYTKCMQQLHIRLCVIRLKTSIRA